MSIFVSTTFLPNESSVIDAVKLLTERNIFNVELGSIHRYEKGVLSLLKNEKCNYIVHNFFPPSKERLILNIASTNEDIRKQSLEFIKGTIDFAKKINASIYTIHPGFLIDPIKEISSSKNYDFDFVAASTFTLSSRYDRCFEIFLNSLNKITSYVRGEKITIAVETQGSISKKDFILLSRPDDFSLFFRENQSSQVGINLNLGHLNLASKAWGFDKVEFIEKLKPRIVALEVSHNDGVDDSHQVLKVAGWYMDLLKDDFFKNIPVIFEGRNLPITEVEKSYKLLKEVFEESF